MTLENLLEIVSRSAAGGPNLCVDSRLAKSGDVFVAVKGAHLDGHNFIEQAIANGAKFIVAQKNTHYDLRNLSAEALAKAEVPASRDAGGWSAEEAFPS